MVTKQTVRIRMPVIFGILLAIMLLIPITAWADETAVTSEDNPSLFIKEGGLPEAASGEIIEMIIKLKEKMCMRHLRLFSTGIRNCFM